MALTVPGPAFAPGFDATLIDQGDFILSSAAQSGNEAAWSMLRGAFNGRAQFECTAKTTDNTAASSAMDLTTLGLTFASKAYRRIRFRSTAVSGSDSWTQDWEQVVWGNDGTTPKLHGSARLIAASGQIAGTAVRYGDVAYHGTTSGATVTDGTDSDTGLSLANFSSGVGVLTVPISRSTALMRVTGTHFSEDAATAADVRLVQVRAASTTTFTVNVFDLGTPTITSPTGVNNIDITLFLPPPPEVKLAMSTNNLQIHCGYNATDNVYHRLEVWASRQDIHLLAID